jgi:RNA polymerase-associated protein CTR9
LKKFFNNKDANILLCLARTQYILGKSEKDPEIMRDALKNTERALVLDPSDKTTLYNLALVQQSYAQQISDLTQEQRTSEDIKRALKYLECGQRSFHMLINVNEHTLYDKKITEQRERYGETLRGQLDRKLADQSHYEEERETKLQLARKKREEEQAKIKREQEEKAQEEKRRLDRTEEERRVFMQKVREDNKSMASRQVDEDDIDEEKKNKKRARKRKERDEEEEEANGDEEEERLNKKDKKVN